MQKTISIIFSATLLYVMAMMPAWADSKTIKVGFLLPYSGVYASLGNDIEAAAKLAFEQHEIKDGHQLEFFREDTEVKPAVGLAKAKKLVLQDKVDVIIGLVSSGVLGAVAPFTSQSKTPLIVANAGNNDATGKHCSPYVVRFSFSNAQMTRPMGAWVKKQGVKTIFTMAPDYAAGRQMIDSFTAEYEKAGGKVLGQEWTPFRKTKDFAPYLAKAKAAGADGLFVFYSGGEAIAFVKQYGSFGIKKELPLYGAGFTTSPLYVAAQGDAALGSIMSLHYIPTIDSPENKRFTTLFTEKYNRPTNEFAVQGYDSARALIEALNQGATDKESIARELPKVNFASPRGTIKIDPATNNIVQNMYAFENIKGADGAITQKVLAEFGEVQDPANGCKL